MKQQPVVKGITAIQSKTTRTFNQIKDIQQKTTIISRSPMKLNENTSKP